MLLCFIGVTTTTKLQICNTKITCTVSQLDLCSFASYTSKGSAIQVKGRNSAKLGDNQADMKEAAQNCMKEAAQNCSTRPQACQTVHVILKLGHDVGTLAIT